MKPSTSVLSGRPSPSVSGLLGLEPSWSTSWASVSVSPSVSAARGLAHAGRLDVSPVSLPAVVPARMSAQRRTSSPSSRPSPSESFWLALAPQPVSSSSGRPSRSASGPSSKGCGAFIHSSRQRAVDPASAASNASGPAGGSGGCRRQAWAWECLTGRDWGCELYAAEKAAGLGRGVGDFPASSAASTARETTVWRRRLGKAGQQKGDAAQQQEGWPGLQANCGSVPDCARSYAMMRSRLPDARAAQGKQGAIKLGEIGLHVDQHALPVLLLGKLDCDPHALGQAILVEPGLASADQLAKSCRQRPGACRGAVRPCGAAAPPVAP